MERDLNPDALTLALIALAGPRNALSPQVFFERMGSFCDLYTLSAARALHNTSTSTVRRATNLEVADMGQGRERERERGQEGGERGGLAVAKRAHVAISCGPFDCFSTLPSFLAAGLVQIRGATLTPPGHWLPML